ncbi:translation initiation factor, partial [Colletotrichum incanum]
LQTQPTPHKSSDVQNQSSSLFVNFITSPPSVTYINTKHPFSPSRSNRISPRSSYQPLLIPPERPSQRDRFSKPSVADPSVPITKPISQGHPRTDEFMSIENLKSYDPFAEADEDTGETKQSQNYIHIRIQQRNGRKTLTTVQGLPKKFDQKKILKVIKKQFACNGTIVADSEMGEVIQLQGDQRKVVQEFLINKKEGLGLDSKGIKVHGF